MEKVCNKCGVSKDIDEFYRKSNTEGYLGACKTCILAGAARNRKGIGNQTRDKKRNECTWTTLTR